jgi:3-methyladenine DNA glycosylase AlkD
MHPIVPFLRAELQKHSDPKRAEAMQAYMKTSQAFHGVSAVPLKKVFRAGRLRYDIKTFDEYQSVIKTLWIGKSREEMYLAIMAAKYYKVFRTDRAMPLYESMLRSASNWDLVDDIAAHLVGDLVLQNRKHEARLRKWTKSENFWMRRSAILAHLFHKKKTNTKLLEETLTGMMHEKEFFIRKAIGWSLRQYAKTDPNWVKRFVRKYENQLSGLSRREALKHVGQI